MAFTLVPRQTAPSYTLSTLQITLLAQSLIALGCADVDLLAPGAYIPSHVASAWGTALVAGVSDLLLVSRWDARRYQLVPATVERRPVDTQPRRRRPHDPPPPPVRALLEREPVADGPLGALLWSVAQWTALSGGFQVTARH